MKLSDSVKLIGRSNDMCPEFERVRRIVQNDFKRPECTPETEHLAYSARVPDESRMVKAFTRSSAGADVELVIDIRSPAACLKTVHYLFGRLDKEGFDYLHAWIWDRTRSVRKDLRTQVVEKSTDVRTLLVCLEASARFYLLSMHQMAQSEKEDYSHQQDMEQFNQTLTTLRERYDDNRRAGLVSDNEAEFVAYRLILASLYASSQLENELHSLPNNLRNNRRVLTAIEIFKAAKSAFNFGSDSSWIQAHANWKKFWELVKSPSVSYLMACAAEVTFNRVRHVILDSIWHAYRRGSKGDVSVEAWTVDKLRAVLAMDDNKDVVRLCELYGFQFERSREGHTFLDISKLGNSNKSLGVPHTIKPQMFSRSLVESKRHNRAFSAVIQGMTVQQARQSGLLVDPSTVQMGGEDSLFIPGVAPAPKQNIFAQKINGTTNGTSSLSPNASPFQPSSQPSTTTSATNPFKNPFAQAAAQSQPAHVTPLPGTGAPTTYDPSKNPIKFAPTPSSITNENPFAKAAAALPTNSTTPSSTPPGSFKFGDNTATETQGQSSSGQTASVPGGVNGQSASDAGKPFVFPGLPELDWKLRNGQLPEPSHTPAGSPPPPDAAAQAAEKAAEREKAEADARAAVLKRKQETEERRKREQEEQERKEREALQAQQAREAEQRRIEEEKQRQLREQQQRELREKQERERLIREEQERRQREEEERLARIRRRETAYNALTSNIVFSGEDGLLYQFLENMVRNVADEGEKNWQAEKRRELEEAEKEKKRHAFARAVFTHWVAQVQKKKRNTKARERRKRLKAQRELAVNGKGAGEGEAASNIAAADSTASTDLTNGASTTRRAPANNNRRARRTQERRASAAADQINNPSQPRAVSSQHPKKSGTASIMTNGHYVRSYSEAYQKSTAPIDRTETDWFKLRAMGIDPSKHRKRSFDSATDEEHKDADPKRVRRSDSTASSISQPPTEPEQPSKPLTLEERLARIRMMKQSFRTSGSGSPPVNGATPSKPSSLNGRSSLLISQARELIAKSLTAKRSSVSVHDFGRSVPNLSASISSFRSSILGKSAGTAQSTKPAYWGRASRFVPQHLYGKGPDAIRAYRDKYNSPTSTPRPVNPEPLALSSPIPAQMSYVPPPAFSLPQYSEHGSGSGSGVDLVDVDAGDNVPGDTEEDSFDGDTEDADDADEIDDEDEDDEGDDPRHFTEEYDDEEGEEEYTDDEEEGQQHFAQPAPASGPGASEFDAIELSD
ncbi:hypothetical protein OPT61_g8006 [Boeremia exigua]|uniref:Uncharacterized protein n=1 Tax=Boeremia exigua TaxID=749465 RepID=A0ACC2I009_9PLEO|nr:hypothetical protein OPT61_g8006 [Boeremia exigua]